MIPIQRSTVAVGALLATGLLVGSAHAELSGNAAATTNYVWRGLTQTDDAAAIQGGIDYAHGSGVYVGSWISNVDFGSEAGQEVDIYGGFSNEVGGFSYDVGYIWYIYPTEGALNFQEYYLGLGYGPFSVKFSYDDDNENLYSEAGLDFELASGVTLNLHVGSYDFDVGTDYVDYLVGITKDAGDGWEFSAYVSDTDLKESDGFGTDVDPRAVLSISKSFGLM